MILIADSGSTKTDWILLDKDSSMKEFVTIGFNPYLQDTEDISRTIVTNLVPHLLPQSVTKIFFYGAGCSSWVRCEVVGRALRENFPKAIVEVDHDLLGAARFLCGTKPGIAAILGTGSNSCYFDGINIAQNFFSLGYILGDEGSGAYMGMKFIKDFLNNVLPTDLDEKFADEYQLSKESIIETVYKKPFANRFFASFTIFLQKNIQHSYASNLVRQCFEDFFDRNICKYPNHKDVPMHCVGSVGFHFSDILKEVALYKGVHLDKIIKSPIEGLVEYHISQPDL